MTTATMIVTGLFFVHVLAWIALPGGRSEQPASVRSVDELGRIDGGLLEGAS